MKKVQIVDGKILNPEYRKQDLPASSSTVLLAISDSDSFQEELEEFSLDLSVNTADEKPERPATAAPDPSTLPTPLPEGVEEVHADDFRSIEGILIPKDQPYLPEEYRPELLVRQGEQHFCPYFTENDISDYGSFMNYLMNTGKSKRTRYDYTIDLRKWKRELEKLGGALSIENINSILSQFRAARAQHLLTVLKSYAEYRNFHQDSKLLILLSTSLTLKKPVKAPKREAHKSTDAVSPEEAEYFRELAKDLCKQGRKEGIWIGLSLAGVPPGNLAKVGFPDQSHVEYTFRRKRKKTTIKKWLYDACQTIEGWRLGRRGIHLGVSKYEITPMALNQHATHHKQ